MPRKKQSKIAGLPMPVVPPVKSKETEENEKALLRLFAKDAAKHHLRCTEYVVGAIQEAAAAGLALSYAKKHVPHGDWLNWLRDNFCNKCGASIKTAQRYIKVGTNIDAILVEARESGVDDPLANLTINRALRLIAHRERMVEESSVSPPTVRGTAWLTPPAIVEAATAVLGPIDLDPAAEAAAKHIPAKRHITRQEDALRPECSWAGTVFLNPGSSGNMARWIEKALAAFSAGDVPHAILVLPATLQPTAASSLAQFPTAFARELFTVPLTDGETAQLKTPLMFVYLTEDADVGRFAHAFSPIANVFLPFQSEKGTAQ